MTHEVANQPPPLVEYDVFSTDEALASGVARFDGGWARGALRELGRFAGSEQVIRWGFEANAYEPVLRTHDRFGNRIDEVDFHPSWHRLMEAAVSRGLHAAPWRAPKPGAHVARVAGFFVWSQVEAGHGCPISMTHAAIPALRLQSDVAAVWEPQLTSLVYDPGLRRLRSKRGALCGMAMTEKQGGSDVRTNTTRAEPLTAGGPGREYALTGHKWFCSAPMCDAFVVLAQAPEGLACFLLPRILPDGTRNTIHIQRLKQKLGNRSNASSEIEFERAQAWLIGEPGRGLQTILEMVNYTRLDCVAGSAALMRQAVAQATHHAAHRSAFGKPLIDQPLMGNVLADLAIESEAATWLTLRLAAACDRADFDPREAALKRIGTAIGKFWVCKRAPALVAEALECHGGNGYVEESILPRLYRESPLNSIWEGSGNVIALDVLRALRREPGALAAFVDEVTPSSGANRHFDAAFAGLQRELTDRAAIESRARRIVERLALVLQAALLLQYAPTAIADAFCTSRLGGDWGRTFGTLPPGIACETILKRAQPVMESSNRE
ncbi:MAG: isovaleryl-CoA dehydrogenase [Vulcanimicrobiaceae bacterium]